MKVFAYTLTIRAEKPIKGLGSLNDIEVLLSRLKLPGGLSPQHILAEATVEDARAEAYSYTHDESGADRWRLKWSRFS